MHLYIGRHGFGGQPVGELDNYPDVGLGEVQVAYPWI